LQNDLRKYGVEAEKAINKAIEDTMIAIWRIAKQRLQEYLTQAGVFLVDKKTGAKAQAKRGHGGSGLTGSIYKRKGENLTAYVGTTKHYAAYIEFGIGEMVFTNMDFSDEAKQVAAQFKGTKKVKGFKGVSYLNWTAVNQEKPHIERIEKELNKIK
jgi:hypothetical protein